MLPLEMITGSFIPMYDIRRSMFRSLVAVQGDSKLDAFEAAAAALYTEGDLMPNEFGIFLYSERALELRMNVTAFYLRCAHFSFSTPALQAWSEFALLEYEFLNEQSLLAHHGLTDFDGTIPSFSPDIENRSKWDRNFEVLAVRLQNQTRVPLWTDLHALQLLFSHLNSPVYFALVYGCVSKTPANIYSAFPQAPDLAHLASLDGPGLLEDIDLPTHFTVVPLFAMEPYSFCFFFHKVFDNSHDLLCQHILSYKPNPLNSITTFRKQPLLRVYGDYLDVSENFSKGH